MSREEKREPSIVTRLFDLGGLTEKGRDAALTFSAAERSAIAQWLDILTVDALTGHVRLTRRGSDLYIYEASFEADVVQACVVTLEPVPAHLAAKFERTYRLLPVARSRRRPPPGGEIVVTGEDDPEILTSQTLDLAAPVLEELSLALDPYPRAPGAAFEAPEEPPEPPETKPDNPFAVLKALKDKPGPKG